MLSGWEPRYPLSCHSKGSQIIQFSILLLIWSKQIGIQGNQNTQNSLWFTKTEDLLYDDTI